MLSCLAMVFYLKNLMIFFSARLPILYTEKETSWLSSMQDWLWTAWCLSPSTAIFRPHQDQFVYVSSPCLSANGEITASFLIQCVWHARFGDAMPRCDWCRALDLGLPASLLDENRHISRWDFQDERNLSHCFCWWERWNGGLGRPRASIKRKIKAAEITTSQLNSPTTCSPALFPSASTPLLFPLSNHLSVTIYP